MENNVAEAVEEKEIEIVEEEDSQQSENSEQDNTSPEESTDTETQTKDEELDDYSRSVRQRISKITHKYREEESARKYAEAFAEDVKKQNEDLRRKVEELNAVNIGEMGSRVESQIESAKQNYQKAFDEGDSEAMFESQKVLSKLALDQAQVEHSTKLRESKKEAPVDIQVPPTPEPAPAPAPDPKAEGWAAKNDWFGQDQTMTYAAYGIHRQLIEDEGFDPTSDEYYTELDKRVRVEFPHKFNEVKRDSGPRVASAESSASNAPSSKTRRTVKLTSSQIAIAKRLNVPLEEYAKYVKE